MAKLLVVGKLPQKDLREYSDGYKGVQRENIRYPFEFYETNHEIINFFEEYEKLTDVNIYLSDLSFAKKLRNFYNAAYPETEMEIIEIVYDSEEPTYKGNFLGFDIIDSVYSNILYIILAFNKKDENQYIEPFHKLLVLVSKNLFPLLNENQLFKTNGEAEMALCLLDGIFIIFNKQSNYMEFKVVKIFAVD